MQRAWILNLIAALGVPAAAVVIWAGPLVDQSQQSFWPLVLTSVAFFCGAVALAAAVPSKRPRTRTVVGVLYFVGMWCVLFAGILVGGSIKGDRANALDALHNSSQ